MTRRDRHVRILENFGSDRVRYHRDTIMARLGLSAFTDEAIDAIARHTVSSHRRQQRYNRENRERITAEASA